MLPRSALRWAGSTLSGMHSFSLTTGMEDNHTIGYRASPKGSAWPTTQAVPLLAGPRTALFFHPGRFHEQTQCRGKILLMLATALVALLFMAVSSLLQQRSQIIESRRELLTTAVQSAHSIVASYQAKAASGAMPVEETQKAAKDALRVSRFGGPEGKTEYFYIWTLDSKGVMHPIKPEWEGQDMAGKVKDGAGTDILKQISTALNASSNGRVFVPTMFARPGSQSLVPKLQYVIRVDGWNWMVGSGLYTDDIDQLVRKTLLSNLAIVLVVMLVVGGVGLLVTRSVLRQIGGEPTDASR